MKTKKQKLIVVLGPTCSGKTDLGIFLAQKYNGEIVSADSRLVYKGLDIGTAKPKKDNQDSKEYLVKNIPHYLIDNYSPKRIFNAALFKKEAIKRIKDIQRRNKTPFLVGGTGLYIDAVVNNLDFPAIKADEELRKELEKKDIQALFKQYQEIDPIGAQNIDKNNKRRLIRAIEVCQTTRKSFWENRRLNEPIFDCLKLGIAIEKEQLTARIAKRTKAMIKQGLKDEALALIKKYGRVPPLETIGYQEWKDYQDKDLSKKELESIAERIIINTNKFAKRQITWFKRDQNIRWIKNKKEADRLIKDFLK